jgi:hypothetical protein
VLASLLRRTRPSLYQPCREPNAPAAATLNVLIQTVPPAAGQPGKGRIIPFPCGKAMLGAANQRRPMPIALPRGLILPKSPARQASAPDVPGLSEQLPTLAGIR